MAYLPRYEGRLWTLCNEADPDKGFCLSLAQAKEIRIRFKQEIAHHKNGEIDAREKQEKAEARLEGEAAAKNKAILTGILAGVGALLLGTGLGVTIGVFGVR